jgi:polyisoprenyl-phosphate glycosyltransferase
MSTASSSAQRISVLVPVFNNETTLEPLCARLDAALAGTDYEVLLVNDGSRDDSLVTLKRLAAANLRLKVISLSRNFGQHPAIAAALDYATGDILVLMDADLEDQPEHVPGLIRTLRESGSDIVYTIKTGDRRRLTSDFYHAAAARSRDASRVHRKSVRGVAGVS